MEIIQKIAGSKIKRKVVNILHEAQTWCRNTHAYKLLLKISDIKEGQRKGNIFSIPNLEEVPDNIRKKGYEEKTCK